MDQTQIVGEIWRTFKRRLVILAVVSLAGMAVAGFYAMIKPPVYETSAKILIESQQIPDDLARSTVNSSAAERLQLIEQRLMARDNLIGVIEKLDLFAERGDLSLIQKIDRLRTATRIRSIAVSGQRRRRADVEISAFTISVRLGDPEQAATIANEFVTKVLEQNLRARAERARETLEFFETEEQRIGAAITALETEITAFKTENEDALPDSLQFRFTELSRTEEQLLERERQLLELDEQRSALEAALESGGPVARSVDPKPQSPEEAELRMLERDYARKKTLYAPNHPDLRRLEVEIEALKAIVPTSPAESAIGIAEGNAEARRRAIATQLAAIDGRMGLIADQKSLLEAGRDELEASIRRTPSVEITLNAYNRRYQELQDQYSLITRKRAEAETGEKLEINQQSERFEVVENALVPTYPVEPNRRKIVALGSAASVGIAIGLVVLIEMLNPVIRSTAQLERQIGTRGLVAIPYVRTRGERRRRAWLRAVLLVLALAGIAAAVIAIDSQVMPLEEIWPRLLEKSGLEGMLQMIDRRLGSDADAL